MSRADRRTERARSFAAMRQGLVDRGLIAPGGDGEFCLTDEGNAHARRMMRALRGSETGCDPSAPRVFWNVDLRTRAGNMKGRSRGAVR